MEIPIFNIFYSWQSYVGGHANRSYIREKIKSYAKTKVDTLNIIIGEDSRGVPGASDIPENILKKIANCDVFICDITPVVEIPTSEGNIRGIPNPNVMFELGFAVRHLGWDRIICILNSEYGNVEYLPFDIAKHKIVTYKKKDGERNAENSLDLSYSLNDIIDHYGDIISKANEFDYINHDKKKFEELMSSRTEEEFIYSIQSFRSSYRYNRWESKGWEFIQHFQNLPKNKFINSILNEKYQILSESINNLYKNTGGIIFSSQSPDWRIAEPDKNYTQAEIKEILESQEYVKKEIPYPKEDSDVNLRKYFDQNESIEMTIIKSCETVLEKYHEFRMAVKQILII
jgi:hypothetical protein